MNRKRRKKIGDIRRVLDSCSNDLSLIEEDESISRDNMPESLQTSDAYCTSEDCSEKLDSAISCIDQAIEFLDDI